MQDSEHLEPTANDLAGKLNSLAATGAKVSGASLLSPMLFSIAISLKRLADHHSPVEGEPTVGGYSQADHNLSDALQDRVADLTKALQP